MHTYITKSLKGMTGTANVRTARTPEVKKSSAKKTPFQKIVGVVEARTLADP